jgi:hypothetical protein
LSHDKTPTAAAGRRERHASVAHALPFAAIVMHRSLTPLPVANDRHHP